MADHGHDLALGSFPTPTAASSERVVERGALSEQVGLDLVPVQDHPYPPRLLDTWTLRGFLAARTRTVTLAADVTNLPLRPPAVLPRSVASLGLLSGGRVELRLGAGARGGARLERRHDRLAGAEGGPAPAHDLRQGPPAPWAAELAGLALGQGLRPSCRRPTTPTTPTTCAATPRRSLPRSASSSRPAGRGPRPQKPRPRLPQ